MPSLARCNLVVQDEDGNIVDGASIEVRDEDTLALPQCYSDRAGATPIGNPFTAADGANAGFHVVGSKYKITATLGAFSRTWRYQGIGTAAEWDIEDVYSDAPLTGTPTAPTAAPGSDTSQLATTEFVTDAIDAAVSTIVASAAVMPPQGRLSLVSGLPVMVSDQTAKTDIFWMPYGGNLVPIWDGSAFVLFPNTSQRTMALTSGVHASAGIYDLFSFLDGNSPIEPIIGSGPIWTAGAGAGSVTAGACARGTGAASTQLEQVNGIWVNKNTITLKNGSSTYSNIAARKATYIGSFSVDAAAGQVSCHVSYGQSRKWALYNPYPQNQVDIVLLAGDPNASWTYGTNTIRASRADATNKLTPFIGLPDQPIPIRFNQRLSGSATVVPSSTSTATLQNGIGINSTTVMSGTRGTCNYQFGNSTVSSVSYVNESNGVAEYTLIGSLGINNVQALEVSPSSSNATDTYNGTEASMILSARWRG